MIPLLHHELLAGILTSAHLLRSWRDPWWQPRYANWGRLHGRSPEDQLLQDRSDWPGGSMCGFTLWNNERITDYARAYPERFFSPIKTSWDRHGGRPILTDHEGYDIWLTQWVNEKLGEQA